MNAGKTIPASPLPNREFSHVSCFMSRPYDEALRKAAANFIKYLGYDQSIVLKKTKLVEALKNKK
jgi:hypothetical protein